jgi:hypothetical protein
MPTPSNGEAAAPDDADDLGERLNDFAALPIEGAPVCRVRGIVT